jgi:hypothetical protein
MYSTMDDEVFLAPESIIYGLLEQEPAADPTADLDFHAAPDDAWTDSLELA